MTTKIKVLVTDDSSVVRKLLRELIDNEHDMEVCGVARDGVEALELCKLHQPDVLTLDIAMPRMDGLQALEAVMENRPMPVIMVSKLVQSESDVALKALDLGAFDILQKPSANSLAKDLFRPRLAEKIRSAAQIDIQKMIARRQTPHSISKVSGGAGRLSCLQLSDSILERKCVALGVSTGGPPALARLIANLERPMPPIFIVQHMPEAFTSSFANRLNRQSNLEVVEAADGELVKPDQVYIAPGSDHMKIVKGTSGNRILLCNSEPVNGHRPAVDLLMKSAAEVYGDQCLGVIMTGMGRDGVDGCVAIKNAGGMVLGQDQESSDVYGMNKLALEAGAIDQQFNLSEAAEQITRFLCEGALALQHE